MPLAPRTKHVKIASEEPSTAKLTAKSSPPEDDIDPAQFLEIFESESSSEDEDGGIPLEKLPDPPKPSKSSKTALQKAVDDNQPGVLYVGHIPHGFYEPQMRAYFSQFGTITPGRLRISRNRRTGASKHYAFIQFDSSAVADIVQRTMDKYLLFDHILQVKRVPNERVHEKLWVGAEKRFKKIPWNRMEARGLAAPRSREVWDKRIAREEARRHRKKKVIEEYGYEFEMPKLKKTADVLSRSERERIEAEKTLGLLENASEAAETKKRKSTSEKDVDEPEPVPAKKRPRERERYNEI